MTYEEALCLKFAGWRTDDELELYQEADTLIRRYAHTLVLKHQLAKVQQQIAELDAKEKARHGNS